MCLDVVCCYQLLQKSERGQKELIIMHGHVITN